MSNKPRTSPELMSDIPTVNPGDYEVLKPDAYHTESKSQEELLEKYIGLLVPLAEKMVGKNEPGFDAVVFLDKSARPLAQMIREFWPYIAPQQRNEEGELETAPMPKMHFANIDRLLWRKDHTKEFDDGGMRSVEKKDIDGLRAIYNVDKQHNLDDQRLLLVDEQSETGDTLKIAKELFSRAFPASEVDTTAWINHHYSVNSSGIRESRVKEIPMWYPPKDIKGLHDESGRGVFNPVAFSPDNPDHLAKRFPPESYQFLSTPATRKTGYLNTSKGERLERERLKLLAEEGDTEAGKSINKVERDQKSLQLRREIGRMLIDFTQGRLHPPILSKREEILGMPMREYNLQARAIREKRPKY